LFRAQRCKLRAKANSRVKVPIREEAEDAVRTRARKRIEN